MDWTECKKKFLAKEIKPDKNLINSIIGSSKKKENTQKSIDLNDETASSKLSLAYDSLRELLEALSILKGYKIYNHECYTYFLKEILNELSLGTKFDKLRKIRNLVNYYGKEISPEEVTSLLKDIEGISRDIKSRLK
jgi:hypothetical protein